MKRGILITALVAVGLAGCGVGDNISRDDLGANWPLLVDFGELRCEGQDGVGAVIFTDPDGNEYGVNGTARSWGYPPIDPLWRPDPGAPGMKVSMGPLIDRGLALCG